jgi:ribosome-binding ATPase
METGILGLPKSGKTTLFNILTAARQTTDKFTRSGETHVGVAVVPDPRLEKLRDLFQPKKFTPATVRYVDVPGIERGEGAAEAVDLDKLKTVDAMMHVVRAFEDAELPHPEGSVDPARDVESVDLELVLADHGLVERRIERLEKSKKRGLSPEEEREKKLLVETVLPALEAERQLRTMTLDPDDERRLRGFQLLSAKPLLVVLNVGEAEVATADPASYGIEAGEARQVIVVSAPIEEEISRLAPDEQREFLADLGLAEPPAARVLRATLELLGRVAFFTVGEDEVRAWTVRRAATAVEAAATIHTDLARGFIRAEVVGYDELLQLGGMARARSAGRLRLEGKQYQVQDGEIMHVKFNV